MGATMLPVNELPPLRRKLPAYGRALLQARRQGQHPAVVRVVWGNFWSGVDVPKLGVRPRQFVPGRYDWRVVAGVKVELIDRWQGIDECNVEAGEFGPFFDLVAELVDAGGYVVVRYPAPSGDHWVEEDADALAFSCRVFRDGRFVWPRWWSDGRDAMQRAAMDGYLADAGAALMRKGERVHAGQQQ